MKTKNVIIAVLSVVVVLLLGVLVNLKRANDLAEYARANNCTWYATGSYYGDDRDYVCK